MDKKTFLIKYQYIFEAIANRGFMHWQSLANISYTHIKAQPKKIKLNHFLPVRQGIGSIPMNSIFINHDMFINELKHNLKPDQLKKLIANKHNPKIQLIVLRDCGY